MAKKDQNITAKPGSMLSDGKVPMNPGMSFDDVSTKSKGKPSDMLGGAKDGSNKDGMLGHDCP